MASASYTVVPSGYFQAEKLRRGQLSMQPSLEAVQPLLLAALYSMALSSSPGQQNSVCQAKRMPWSQSYPVRSRECGEGAPGRVSALHPSCLFTQSTMVGQSQREVEKQPPLFTPSHWDGPDHLHIHGNGISADMTEMRSHRSGQASYGDSGGDAGHGDRVPQGGCLHARDTSSH